MKKRIYYALKMGLLAMVTSAASYLIMGALLGSILNPHWSVRFNIFFYSVMLLSMGVEVAVISFFIEQWERLMRLMEPCRLLKKLWSTRKLRGVAFS